MTIHQLYPEECITTPNNVINDAVRAMMVPIEIASIEAREFSAELSRCLLEDPRASLFPELVALGFWLRPASVAQMLRNNLPAIAETIRVPEGIVFQITPGNIDTLFAYTMVISLLCGNVTIIRLSSKSRSVQQLLVSLMTEVMSSSPAVLRNRMIVLRYDHDEVTTGLLSSKSNLRLVWGSDATIESIRQIPLPPLANEYTFCDRFSSAAINVDAYIAGTDKERADLITNFANDIYWFDQQACSSPRLLLWIGEKEKSVLAANDFYKNLIEHPIAKNYKLDASMSLAKLNSSYLALHDLPTVDWKIHSPALTTISIDDLEAVNSFKRVNYGYGLLLTSRLDNLRDLALVTEGRDQTLGLWGFKSDAILEFINLSQGRGYVRLKPIGQALAFDPIWDGLNLFTIMTRLIHVKV